LIAPSTRKQVGTTGPADVPLAGRCDHAVAAQVDPADRPGLQRVERLLVEEGGDRERQKLRRPVLPSRPLGCGRDRLRIREPLALGGEPERLLPPGHADHSVDVLDFRLLAREAQRREHGIAPSKGGDGFLFGGRRDARHGAPVAGSSDLD
jgi:hypothetical protein